MGLVGGLKTLSCADLTTNLNELFGKFVPNSYSSCKCFSVKGDSDKSERSFAEPLNVALLETA